MLLADRALVDKDWGKLWLKVENQPVAATQILVIPKKGQQEKRTAIFTVRFTTVTLRPPWRPKGKKLPAIAGNAVLVREDNPAPNVTPIEWLLLTNTPVEFTEDAVQISRGTAAGGKSRSFTKSLSPAAP